MNKDNLKKQIDFLIEIDKIKSIFRQTKLFNGSREENDAEHAWHLALMAMILADYANEQIDVGKVIKMVLIHDIVEIDAGDTLVYNIDKKVKIEQEKAASERIFGILPEEQKIYFISLWEEFEEQKTPEAKFAAALDRLEPVMQNYYTKCSAWKKHNISYEQIVDVNKHIENGSSQLWDFASSLIDECLEKEYITCSSNDNIL